MKGQGTMIAKRSISLVKSYPIIAGFMSALGAVFGATGAFLTGVPVAGGASSGQTVAAIPYLAVPMQSIGALLMATPVLMLFVYDKNNGVLEYLLSLGMTQRDVYSEYLKASLLLAAGIAAADVVLDFVIGGVQGTLGIMAAVAVLVAALGISAAGLTALLMMSFSSLQKQRVGSNQPLGLAIGAFLVMPTYLLPFIIPGVAFALDLTLAGAVIVLTVLTFFLAGRLIKREKLLP